jgi:hypothetical protein
MIFIPSHPHTKSPYFQPFFTPFYLITITITQKQPYNKSKTNWYPRKKLHIQKKKLPTRCARRGLYYTKRKGKIEECRYRSSKEKSAKHTPPSPRCLSLLEQ